MCPRPPPPGRSPRPGQPASPRAALPGHITQPGTETGLCPAGHNPQRRTAVASLNASGGLAVQPCVVLGAAREDGGSAAARESCSALGGCHDRRLLQHGHAAGALARPKAGGAILARYPARTQRPGRHALRALRSSSRFAPSFVLCPGALVATLSMQWRYLARLGDPSGSLAAAARRR